MEEIISLLFIKIENAILSSCQMESNDNNEDIVVLSWSPVRDKLGQFSFIWLRFDCSIIKIGLNEDVGLN